MGLCLKSPRLASKARQKHGLQSLYGKPRLFPPSVLKASEGGTKGAATRVVRR
jgi:hypothetical protein